MKPSSLSLVALALAAGCGSTAPSTAAAPVGDAAFDAHGDAGWDSSEPAKFDGGRDAIEAGAAPDAGDADSTTTPEDAATCSSAVSYPSSTCVACMEQYCCTQAAVCNVITYDGGLNGCQVIQTCVNACFAATSDTDGGTEVACQNECESEYPAASSAYVDWNACLNESCFLNGC